jgi:hypothetical protein
MNTTWPWCWGWIYARLHGAAECAQPTIVQRDAAGFPQQIVGEGETIRLRLETQQIEVTHRADQLGMRGNGHQNGWRGKRRVQEQPDMVAQPGRTHRLRQT